MTEIGAIGIDIAKRSFQVHGVDRSGAVVVRRPLTRSQALALFAKSPALLDRHAITSPESGRKSPGGLAVSLRRLAKAQSDKRRLRANTLNDKSTQIGVDPHRGVTAITSQDQSDGQSMVNRIHDPDEMAGPAQSPRVTRERGTLPQNLTMSVRFKKRRV